MSRYDVLPRLDVVIVVNTAGTPAGRTLRESVAKALHERARQLAEGDDSPSLRGVWNPLDVRAFVADGTLLSPREQSALTWREENATTEGATAFATAAQAALAAGSVNEARPEGIVATLHDVLAVAATPSGTARLVVLVSTEDDTSAPAIRDSLLRPEDAIIVARPSAGDGTSCSGVVCRSA